MTKRDPYFVGLQTALLDANLFAPTLIVDSCRLEANADTICRFLPKDMGLRIVAKSLPSPKMLEYVMAKCKTDRLMTFNLAMLQSLASQFPSAHQLLGKPLPVAALRAFLTSAQATNKPRVTWLIDTLARLEDYRAASKAMGVELEIALELDVGLHRGGFGLGEELQRALSIFRDSNHLKFGGYMGYEPHIPSFPKALGWQNKARDGAWAIYKSALVDATRVLGETSINQIIRNAAGSPTYRLYQDTNIANEVSIGSSFVKPTDFDTELLQDHVPATFIATPVLKGPMRTQLPGLEAVAGVSRKIEPHTAETIFIHGGHWLATPVDPAGLSYNPKFGRSSNQEMLNGAHPIPVKPDDFVFLRPHQSEAVFLQFGDIAVYDGKAIVDYWPVESASA